MNLAAKQLEMWDRISELNLDALTDSEHPTSSSSSEHRAEYRPGPINDEKPHHILDFPKLAVIREWRRNITVEEQVTPPSLAARPDPQTSEGSSAVAMDDANSVYERREYQRVRSRQWENRRRARDARLVKYSRTGQIPPTERSAQQKMSYKLLRERQNANTPEQNAEFAEYLAVMAARGSSRKQHLKERASSRDRTSIRPGKRQRRSRDRT
jgi:hypothetical protein